MHWDDADSNSAKTPSEITVSRTKLTKLQETFRGVNAAVTLSTIDVVNFHLGIVSAVVAGAKISNEAFRRTVFVPKLQVKYELLAVQRSRVYQSAIFGVSWRESKVMTLAIFALRSIRLHTTSNYFIVRSRPSR